MNRQTMMKSSLLLLTMALLAGLQAMAQPEPEKPALAIRNFLWVNTDYCTGGQPKLEDLAALKAQGVRAIINLRRPAEYDHAPNQTLRGHAAEEARAKELGLRYFNIPVDPEAPADAQAEEFLKLMADSANRPAFIHCASASRVGAFWMIWRVRAQGWSLEEAEKEADRIGLSNPRTRAFAREHLARQSKKPPE